MKINRASSLVVFSLIVLYGIGIYGMIAMFARLPDTGQADGGNPSETLRAPFAPGGLSDQPLSEAERNALHSPENVIAVNKPHRSAKYILDWAAEATASAMTFSPDEAAAHIKEAENIFAASGMKDYQNYLKSTDLVAYLQKNNLRMQSFVQSTPILQNEGDFGGVYRWLIDVPITVSHMPVSMNSYVGRPNANSQTITVRLQVGRTQDPNFADGIAIERWTVLGAS